MPGSIRRSGTDDSREADVGQLDVEQMDADAMSRASTKAGPLGPRFAATVPALLVSGEVVARQPTLLPALATPSTSLPARTQRQAGMFRRVTGLAWVSGILLLLIVL